MIRDHIKRIAEACISRVVRFSINGPSILSKAMAYALSVQDDRRYIETREGILTVRTGNPTERFRADSFFTKEPDTIAWMDRTISSDSIFYDIGANIGLYSLYASHLFRGETKVLAFEPEALNFARLNQNVFDNALSENVLCFCMGLGDHDEILEFPVAEMTAGKGLNGSFHVHKGSEAHRHGMVVFRLDDLLANNPDLPAPTHLKIDVDGPELAIVKGARTTLENPRLRHILIETTAENHREIADHLEAVGFHETDVGEEFRGMSNHIFMRS